MNEREESPPRGDDGGKSSSNEAPPLQSPSLSGSDDDDALMVGDGASQGRRVRPRGDTDAPEADPSRRERRSLERSVRKGKKAAEFERHKRRTYRREKGRTASRDLVQAALHQLKRQSRGEELDSNEQQLATYATNLSPAKILGAGIRIGAGASSEGSGDDSALDLLETTKGDDDSVDELMEELGCSAQEASDALNRSCRWTASGNSSRIKAANWLRREMEEPARHSGHRVKASRRDGSRARASAASPPRRDSSRDDGGGEARPFCFF